MTKIIKLQAQRDVELQLEYFRDRFPVECDHAGTGGFVVALAVLVKSLEARIDELESKPSLRPRRLDQILAVLKTCDWAAWGRVIEGLESKGSNTERDINATIVKMRRLRDLYDRYASEEEA